MKRNILNFEYDSLVVWAVVYHGNIRKQKYEEGHGTHLSLPKGEQRPNLNRPPGGVGRCAVGVAVLGVCGRGVWNTRKGGNCAGRRGWPKPVINTEANESPSRPVRDFLAYFFDLSKK
jgi:hypothetical protein